MCSGNFLPKVVLIASCLLFTGSIAAAVEKEGAWSKAGKEIGEAAHAVGHASKDSFDKTMTKGAGVMEKTTTASSEAWGEAKKTSAEAWGATKDTSVEAWHKTKEGSAELYDKAKGKIHEMTGPVKE